MERIVNLDKFDARTYGWKELALLYSPGLTVESASKRLARWVKHNPDLYDALIEANWQPGKHLLTPNQVEIIVFYLGEP